MPSYCALHSCQESHPVCIAKALPRTPDASAREHLSVPLPAAVRVGQSGEQAGVVFGRRGTARYEQKYNDGPLGDGLAVRIMHRPSRTRWSARGACAAIAKIVVKDVKPRMDGVGNGSLCPLLPRTSVVSGFSSMHLTEDGATGFCLPILTCLTSSECVRIFLTWQNAAEISCDVVCD
ncbi:hypothetical protein BV20DRAFT_244027 [Pilatotrama ljubarskyi]|nr:hypothetical protein BV20DRAFT_244027 [Pilatotrama ljubarskyi]